MRPGLAHLWVQKSQSSLVETSPLGAASCTRCQGAGPQSRMWEATRRKEGCANLGRAARFQRLELRPLGGLRREATNHLYLRVPLAYRLLHVVSQMEPTPV